MECTTSSQPARIIRAHAHHGTVTAYIIWRYRGALYFSAIFAEVKQFLYFLTVTTTEHNKTYFVNTFKTIVTFKNFLTRTRDFWCTKLAPCRFVIIAILLRLPCIIFFRTVSFHWCTSRFFSPTVDLRYHISDSPGIWVRSKSQQLVCT